jgi:hypothetical protein
MPSAQEILDLLYLTALQHVPLGGGIAEVDREGQSVLLYGAQPRGLRGVYHPPTCVQVAVAPTEVRAIVLGGRPGIPVGSELFRVAVADQPAPEVVNEVLGRVGTYLAQSTS